MSWKDLLVVLDPGADTPGRVELAVALAERFAAHLVGLYSIPSAEPRRHAAYPDLAMLEPVYHEWRERALEQAEAARLAFEDAARRRGLAAEWRAVTEGPEADPVIHARCADLAILGQRDPDNEQMAMFRPSPEPVILGTGRPVLAVPYAGQFATVGRHVLIAWNAGREAARAVADAMPLLTIAERVDVLIVDPPPATEGSGEAPGSDLARYLARHAVEVQIERTQSAGVPVGELILSRAADLGADLLVMGAYGHSRARELLLGGATRSILASMTIPVLMSH
ncbi:MAG TPA: universal stress protein [Stellaceae bacterium]|jgi:nucleotide-binding universal stress UspA family protein